jgi:hypothetical protein
MAMVFCAVVIVGCGGEDGVSAADLDEGREFWQDLAERQREDLTRICSSEAGEEVIRADPLKAVERVDRAYRNRSDRSIREECTAGLRAEVAEERRLDRAARGRARVQQRERERAREEEEEDAPPSPSRPPSGESVEDLQRRLELGQRLSDEIQANVEARGTPNHIDGRCTAYADRYRRVAGEDERIGRQLAILCPGQFEQP